MSVYRTTVLLILALAATGVAAIADPVSAPVTTKPLIRQGTILPPPHSTPTEQSCYLSAFKKVLKMTNDWDLAHGTACGVCKMKC